MEILQDIDFKNINRGMQANETFSLPFDIEQIERALNNAYYAEVIKRNRSYNTDSEIFDKAHRIAKWLTNKQSRPGLLLYGKVGTGKTTFVNAICRVINFCCKAEPNERTLHDSKRVISMIRAKDIVEAWQNDKDYFNRMCNVPLLAVDEFGIEAIDVKSYGNTNEPIIDMLSSRYDRQRTTIISSNLDMEGIKERYGERLQDRFNEMFTTISFNGQSFRN